MGETVIVGGGIAGMTAAICLAEAGQRVTVLEKTDRVGGNLCGWKRQGCLIDNCLHWLCGTKRGTPLRALWEKIGLLDDSIALRRTPYFYRSMGFGATLSLWRDLSRTEREMLLLSPGDRREIKRFVHAVKSLREGGNPLERSAALVRFAPLSLADLAARFRHPLLRALLTDYIGGEFSSLGLLFAYAAYLDGNADLPSGGSVAAAERLEKRLLSLGGKIEKGSRVTRVLIDRGRVHTLLCANGRAYPAETVLFACDPHVTFGKLLARSLAPRALEKGDRSRAYPTVSSIHAAFSVKTADLPFTSTVCLSGRAGCHAARAGGRMAVRAFDHEPDFAPNGKTALQVMLFVDGAESDAWIALAERDPAAYKREKARFAADVAQALKSAFPSLRDSLELLDAWTPATYRRYTDSYRGDYMGYVLGGGRLPLRLPTKIRGLKNAYLASSWQTMPSGLPSAARAGERAAAKILLKMRQENPYQSPRKSRVGY
jgi:phytoene dehydrogenase-like protein